MQSALESGAGTFFFFVPIPRIVFAREHTLGLRRRLQIQLRSPCLFVALLSYWALALTSSSIAAAQDFGDSTSDESAPGTSSSEEDTTTEVEAPAPSDSNKMPPMGPEPTEGQAIPDSESYTQVEEQESEVTRSTPLEIRPVRKAEQTPTETPLPPSSTNENSATKTADATASEKPSFQLSLGGYVEGYYSYNFRKPSNDITNLRGFDFRHNTITLANASVYASFESKAGAFGHLALQWGQTPRSYYQVEPDAPATSFTGTSDGELWEVIQEAYVGYHAPIGLGLDIKAGLMLSPLGYESITAHNNFHWSIANASLALPFYHTGVTFRQSLHDTTGLTLGVFNGWNSVVDNNKEKSLLAAVDFDLPCGTIAQIAYFTGVEAEPEAEDRDWRHLFNLWAVLPRLARMQIAFQADAGLEPRDSVTLWWTGAILDVDLAITDWLHFAVRGDFFLEDVPSAEGVNTREGAIFFPVRELYGATTTLRTVLKDQLALYLEYRYDNASDAAFFDENTVLESEGDPVANRRSQHTATIGFTGWYDHTL